MTSQNYLGNIFHNIFAEKPAGFGYKYDFPCIHLCEYSIPSNQFLFRTFLEID